MKKLKGIEFNKDRWRWGEITEFEKDKLILVWKRYIKLIEENKELDNNTRVLLRSAFIEGILVGILDIKYSVKKVIKVYIPGALILLVIGILYYLIWQ